MATEADIPQDAPAKHNTGLEDRDLIIEQFQSISNECSREGSVKPSYGLNQFPQGFKCSLDVEKADAIVGQTKNINSAELSSPDKAPTEYISCEADTITNQELRHICADENLHSKNIETGAHKNEVIDGINVEEEHVHETADDAAQESRLGDEDQRVTESSIKDEDIDNDNTIYGKDQYEEIRLKSGQNEKTEMPSVQEVKRKAPESIVSSDKSEHCYEEHKLMHDSNEDASAVNVEESPYKHSLEEAASENTPKDRASTEGVALEAGKINNQASFKAYQEKNKDNESIWKEKDVPPIGGKDITEKSTWLNRDDGEAKEDEFNQTGLSETIENSKITPENAERSTEEVSHPIEKYDKEEEKDQPTSIVDGVETSLPTEKSQLPVESTTKNEREELKIPQENASDVDSKYPLVEKTEQAESGKTCKVSQTEQTNAEIENQATDQSEEEIIENMITTHANSEGMETIEITPKPSKGSELKVPKAHTEMRVEIVDVRKIIPEAADDIQLHKIATESELENEATSRSSSTEFIRDEAIEQGFQEESTKDAKLTLATDNESPTQESIKDVEINTKVDEAFDEHKSTDRENTLDVISEGISADPSGVLNKTICMVVVDDSKKNETEDQEGPVTTFASQATSERTMKEGEQSHTENSVLKSQEKENTPRTLSSTSGMETGKEHQEEDEETKEQIMAAYSTERKISSSSDDFTEPKENLGDLTTEENKNNLVENSPSTSGVFEKDDYTTNDSETNFLNNTGEGNMAMKEVIPINEDPLENSDDAPENRNIETIETKSISLDYVDIDEKQEEEVISEENRSTKVADVADKGGQEMSHDIKDKAQITRIKHKNEVTVSTPEKTPATDDEGIQKHPEEDMVMLKAQNNISGREETEQWKGEKFSSFADENDTSELEIAKEKSIVDVSNNIDDVSCNEKADLEEKELVKKSEANSAVVAVEREAAEQTKIESSITEEPDETKDDELKDENEASHLVIAEEASTVEVPKHIEDVSCMDSKKAEQKNEELVEKAEANSAAVGEESEAAELTKVGNSSTKEELADTEDAELADKNAAIELETVKEETSTVEMLKHVEDVLSHSLEDVKADQEDKELVEKSEANSLVSVETEAAELKAVSSITEEEPAETKDDEREVENEASHFEIVKEESTVEVPKHIEDVPCMDKEKTELENEELVKIAEANSAVVGAEREATKLTEIGSSSTKEELSDTKDSELADKNAATELEIVKEEKSTTEMLKHIEDVPSHSLDNEKADLEDKELVEKYEASSTDGAEREAAKLKAGSSITEEEPAETKTKYDELKDENEASHLEIVEEESTIEVQKHIDKVSYMDSTNAKLKNEELVKKVKANPAVVGAEREADELTEVGCSSTKEELADTKNAELADQNAATELEIVKEEQSTVAMLKYIEDVPAHSLDDEKADLEDAELVEKSEANSPVGVEREPAELKEESSTTEEEPAETKNDELEDENESSHLEIVEESTVEVPNRIEEVSCINSTNAEPKNEEPFEKVEANSAVAGEEREAVELTEVGSSSTKEELADTKNAELADKNAGTKLKIVKEEKSTVEMLKHIEDVPAHSLDDEKADLEGGELLEKSETNSSVGVERGAAKLKAGSSITEEETAETKYDELEDENEASHLKIVEEESTVEVPKHIEDVTCMDSKIAEQKNEELVEKVEANSAVVGAEREAAELTEVGSSSTKEELAEMLKHIEDVEMLKHIEDVPSHSLKGEKLVEKSEANSSVGAEREAAEPKPQSSITEEKAAETKDELNDENETPHLEIVQEESTIEVPKHIEDVSRMNKEKIELENEELVEKAEHNSAVVGAKREMADSTEVGSSSTEEELADTENAELANKNAAIESEIVKEDRSIVEVLKPTKDVLSQSLDDEKTDMEDEECFEKYKANPSIVVEREATEWKARSSITEEETAETKDDDLEDENETSHLKIVEESTVEVPKHIEDVSCMDKEKTELENEELVEEAKANSAVVAEREAAEQIEVGSSSTEDPAEIADNNAAFKLEIVKEEKSTVEVLKHVEDFSSYSLDNENAKTEVEELVEKQEANSSVGVEREAAELNAGSSIIKEMSADTKVDELEDEREACQSEIVEDASTVEMPKHVEDVSCMDKEKIELEGVELAEKGESNSAVAAVEREATELEAKSSSTEEEPINSKNDELLIEKTDRTYENSPCESGHNVDSPEKIVDMSQQKKEESLLGENENSNPEGASIDNHHEHAYSSSVGEDIGEESGLIKGKDQENVKENEAESPEVLMTDGASQATGEEIIKTSKSSNSEASVPKSQEETENTVGTFSSALVGKEKGKEYPNDDKNEDTKTTEEVQVTNSESKEEMEETCVENFSEISSIEQSKGASKLGSSENEKENSDEGIQKHQDEHEALASELKTETSILDTEDIEQKTPLTDENEASKMEIVKDGKLTVQVSKHIEDVWCTDIEKAKLEDDQPVEKSEGNSAIVAVKREASELKAGRSGTEVPVDTKNDELADGNVASKLEIVEDESAIEVPRHIENASCMDNKKTELENEDLVEQVEGNLIIAAVEREAAELTAGSSSTEEEPADTKNDELVERNDAPDLEIVEDESIAAVPKHIEDASCAENEKAELDELADKNDAPNLEIAEDQSTAQVPKHIEDASCAENEKTELENEDLADKVEGNSAIVEVERETSELEAAIYSTEEEPTDPKSDEVGVADGDDAPNLEIESTTGVPKHAEDASYMDNEKIELVNEDLVEKVEGNSAVVTEEREAAELRISNTEEEPADPKTDEVADGNDASGLEIVKNKSTIGVPKHAEDASCVDNEKVELENEDLVEKAECKPAIVAVDKEAAELKAGISSTEEPVDPKSDELADGNDAPKLEIVKDESTIGISKYMEDASRVENEDLVEKLEANSAIFAAEREAVKLHAESSSTNEEPTNPKSDKLVDGNDASKKLIDGNDASKVEIVEDESTIEVTKHAEDASSVDNGKIKLENEDHVEKIEDNPEFVVVERGATELKAGSSRNEEEPSETNTDELLRKEADGKDEDTHTKSDHNMGSTEKILSILVTKKEESHIPGGASLEDEDECTHSIGVVDDEKSGLAESKDGDAEITPKSKEQLKQTPQNDGKQFLEELPDMISEGSKAEASTEYPENTNTAEEPTTTRLEKFSQMKNEAENQEVPEPSSTEASVSKPQEIENTVGTLSTASVGMETGKEYSNEKESQERKLKVTIEESKEQTEATYLLERETSETLHGFSEPKVDHHALCMEENKNNLVENSPVLEVFEKDDCHPDHSENKFLRATSEPNPAILELKPVNQEQLQGTDGTPEMKDVTAIEPKANNTGQVEETNSRQNRYMKVQEVADEGVQKLPLNEEPKEIETNMKTDKTPEIDGTLYVESGTLFIVHSEGPSVLRSSENEKEDENEGIHKHKDEDQALLSDLKTETSISNTEEIEQQKREQFSGLADENEGSKLETIKDERSTFEGKDVLEEKIHAENAEENSAVVGLEKEATEMKARSLSTEEEPANTKNGETQIEKTFNDLQSNRTDEDIPCESNENVEGPAEILITSLKTKDKSSSEEHDYPTPREDFIEVQDEYAAKHNDEEDSKQLLQNDGKERLKELPDVIFAGKLVDVSREYLKSTTSTTAEKTTARLKRTSQKGNIEGNMKDTDNTKGNEAENQQVFESSNTEDSVSKPQDIENTVWTLPSAAVETEPRKEYPEEDESEETKMKEEVKITMTQPKEQVEDAYPVEEKVSNISDYFLEPKEVQGDWSTEENKNNLVGDSSSISGVSDKEQLETSDPTTENKHATDIEAKANSLDSVNIDEKQEEETISEEKRDLKVAEVEDESGQQMSCDIKDAALITGINHEKEVTISTALLDDQSVHTFIDSSALPAYEEPKTKDKTPEIDRTIYVHSETSSTGHSKGDSLLESSDNKKEKADEGIQKPKDEDLDVPSERITENNDDREKWKTEQSSDLADRHDASKLENVNDEESIVEVSKHIEVVTCLNSEKAVLKDKELVEEYKDSSAIRELERETASPNAEEEPASTKNGELLIEKVHYNDETANNTENIKELLTGIRTISVGEEIGNKVEVSSSGFKEQTEATELTVEKESVTLESHTEQHKEIIDFGASASTDASKSCSEHSSFISKVYEEQTEAEVIDKAVIDDVKKDSVTVVIEETELKKVEQVNEKNNKGSNIASDNYSLTTIAPEEITLDSKDLDKRQTSLKKAFLDEANEAHLKKDCRVEEADKTTAIQHEREAATSSIPMSIEEKDTMTAAKINTKEIADETAETHLQARENNLQQKEHEVGEPAGGTELETVDIKMKCSNDNIIKQENENLHMLSHENAKATSTCKEGEVTQGQENLAHEDLEKFRNSSNFIAAEKLPAEFTKRERNELPEEKILEPAHIDTKLKSSSDSEAHNQTNEQLPQIKEKRDSIQDWISVSLEHIPGQASMTSLVTKEVYSGVDEAGGSENIEEHTRDSEDNLTELQTLSASDTTVNQVKDQTFTSTENLKATESSEHKVKVGLTIEDDPTRKEAATEVLKLESSTRQVESDVVSEINENVLQMPLEPIKETIAEVREEKIELPEEPPQAAANMDGGGRIGHEREDKRGDECREMHPDSGSKDTEVKVAHKKSHNILSGVGSKVKHSISKVKKAITGKSSHTKSQSPK